MKKGDLFLYFTETEMLWISYKYTEYEYQCGRHYKRYYFSASENKEDAANSWYEIGIPERHFKDSLNNEHLDRLKAKFV